jgi:hypothetical protein
VNINVHTHRPLLRSYLISFMPGSINRSLLRSYLIF